jgi:hypothetical protein
MTAAGVLRLHVEKVLNHEIDDVAGIYDRYDYATEKAAALEACGRSLGRLLRPPGRRGGKCPILEDGPSKPHDLPQTEPAAVLSP